MIKEQEQEDGLNYVIQAESVHFVPKMEIVNIIAGGEIVPDMMEPIRAILLEWMCERGRNG